MSDEQNPGSAERNPRPDGGETTANVSDRFDRLPATDSERTVSGRPTRADVLEWWDDRFGLPPERF
ncbi:MAG: DUF7122 family protein, partial [Halanaeroarchaeum sp.]